jgi:DNA repair protein RadC
MNNLSIKCWAEDDRPREKLTCKGRAALSNSELLAILLGTGTRDKSAVEVAQDLLASCENSLRELGRRNMSELTRVKGIGDAKALSLIAALELARRRGEEDEVKRVKIMGSQDVYRYMQPHLGDLPHEEFHVLHLSRSNFILKHDRVSVGGLNGTVADGKVIFKNALDSRASYIILIHNHPSGSLFPSDHDFALTKKLVDFGKFIDLPVLDHLIYTDNGYFSFSDEGKL